MRHTKKLLPSRSRNLGILTLNNPSGLHALTLDMIHCMQDAFGDWHNDSSLKAILFKSTEAKRPSFCAGGDVKALFENGDPEFFRDEYHLNYAIATSAIPIVSLWDGVVMGGGVGISIHGKYRVATENTLFAMPETAIGLFPDVGSMFWMTQLLKRPMANFLGLTGHRIKAQDLIHTGLATHYVESQHLKDLEKALVDATNNNSSQDDGNIVAGVLESFHEEIPTENSFLAQHSGIIDKTFSASSVEEIIDNLQQQQDSEFAGKTLEKMKKMSPTSMKLTFEGLTRGAMCDSIGSDLTMEYRMATACIRPGSDFLEGVRALLVDKDHDPKWNPDTLEGVSDEMIRAFFAPVQDDLVFPPPPASSKL